MIRESALVDAAEALRHAQRNKVAIAKAQADLLGVSVPTLYRQLKKSGLYVCQRKRRSDRGEVRVDGIDDDKIMEVAALMYTSKRNQGRIIMPAEVAIEVAESNGMIPAGVLTPATLNRHLRKMEADKRALMSADPHIHLRSLHPNHVHQLDYSVGVQWYLDKKGLGERNMVSEVYKNKPDNVADAVAKGKPKLIRCVLTDHFTGLIFVRYYYVPGESARMSVDFLAHAWREKDDGNPFHGASWYLMLDKTGAHRDTGFLAFLDAMSVIPVDHAAGRSNANGQVESAQWIVERRIESRMRISPAKSIEELNEVAALECRKINATLRHRRHRQTRAGLWQTIKPEQLRVIKASHADLLALANKKSRYVPVRGDYTITFEGDSYRVGEIAGASPRVKLEARRNVFDTGTIQVRLHADDPWIVVDRIERMADIDGGWPVDAQVIGEGYRSAVETAPMKHGKSLTRMAYGADTDREAENARKRREKPFEGVDAFKSSKEFKHPDYMKRRGTDLSITAAPEIAPIKGVELLKALASRIGHDLTPDENKAIKSQYPDGMTEDEIKSWVASYDQPEPTALYAVN